MEQAKKYIAEGYTRVVDFDRVNHDILMGRLAKRIGDKRLLKLIRRYLQAGVMIHGAVQERWEGTPQGGPLSPLLSNLLLDELDRELERRGHRFCRYADDCAPRKASWKMREGPLRAVLQGEALNHPKLL